MIRRLLLTYWHQLCEQYPEMFVPEAACASVNACLAKHRQEDQ